MADGAIEKRLPTREERQARSAARQVEADKAMADHEREQKRLRDNREKLKAEKDDLSAPSLGFSGDSFDAGEHKPSSG